MSLNSYEKTDVIFDSIADGVFTIDENWRITSFNKAAEQITGIPRENAIGQTCKDVLRANVCETDCALRYTMNTGKPVINKPVHIVDSQGSRKAITISTALLKDEKGKTIGGVETFRDMTVVEELRKQVQKQYSCEDIISRNHKIQGLFDILPQIADSDCAVLIEGQTGTGKELFARAIHNLSPRRKKSFIAVNCSALPDTLLESELFGYKAGAFTDAKKDKPGRFRLAERGTLFLDEIGDISPALQVRLLRVLQEKTYEPLGSVASVPSDVRIITATNRRLQELVKEGKFREDLYYRIHVIRMELPPLRNRMEDIPLLADHFIHNFNVLLKKEISGLSGESLACLVSYDYPGNVRELQNIIEHAFILCKSGLIEPHHLPENLCLYRGMESSGRNETMNMKDLEAVFITNMLRRHQWNRIKTAKALGIHKSTLFRKIKALNIKIPV